MAVGRRQPLFGMILIRAAQPFFYTPSCSGFSKLMGVRSSGYCLALLTSLSALGTSAGSWLGAGLAVRYNPPPPAIPIMPCLG
jgi:hypothetical protein